jgi:hypothetical protein
MTTSKTKINHYNYFWQHIIRMKKSTSSTNDQLKTDWMEKGESLMKMPRNEAVNSVFSPSSYWFMMTIVK